MHVAVVLSLPLNHAEDNAGDTAEINTERMPFRIAHKCAAVMKTVSFVDNTRIHAPSKVRPVAIRNIKTSLGNFSI